MLIIMIRIILGIVIIETFLSLIIKLSKTFSEVDLLTSLLFLIVFFPICYYIGSFIK